MSQVDIEQADIASPITEPHDSLWQHANFRRLWISESVSYIGTQISLVALPLLAVLTLDASPFEMGLLSSAERAPALFFGMFIGVWVDRLRRKPLLIGADLLRAGLLALVPVLWIMDALSIEMLLGIAFLLGALTIVFNVAWQAMVPAIVGKRHLTEANSKLHVSQAVAQVAGPGAGGLLVGLITAPMAIIVDAASYLISAAALVRIDQPEARPEGTTRSMRHEVGEGLGLVFNDRLMRPLALSGTMIAFFAGIFFAVYLLFLAENLQLGSTAIGLILASGGVGALIGSALVPRFAKRFGDGNTVICGHFLFGFTGLTIPAAVLLPSVALPMVIISEFLQWGWHIVALVSEISIRQTVTPDRLLGRMASTFTFLKSGAMPIGALVGGVLGEVIGVPATLIVSSVGFLAAFIFVFLSPVRGYRSGEE